MVHSPQVHQGRGRGHRGHPAAGRRPRPGHELCRSRSGRRRLRHKLPWLTRSSAAAAAFGMRLELSLNAMNTRAAGRSVHICLPRGGICHGDCGDRCVCTVSGWKVSSYLPEAIVRVLKGLGTRVGAHGARPGEGEGRAFYAKTACRFIRRPQHIVVAPSFRTRASGGIRLTPGLNDRSGLWFRCTVVSAVSALSSLDTEDP